MGGFDVFSGQDGICLCRSFIWGARRRGWRFQFPDPGCLRYGLVSGCLMSPPVRRAEAIAVDRVHPKKMCAFDFVSVGLGPIFLRTGRRRNLFTSALLRHLSPTKTRRHNAGLASFARHPALTWNGEGSSSDARSP